MCACVYSYMHAFSHVHAWVSVCVCVCLSGGAYMCVYVDEENVCGSLCVPVCGVQGQSGHIPNCVFEEGSLLS